MVKLRLVGALTYGCPKHLGDRIVAKNEVIEVADDVAEFFAAETWMDSVNNVREMWDVVDENEMPVKKTGVKRIRKQVSVQATDTEPTE